MLLAWCAACGDPGDDGGDEPGGAPQRDAAVALPDAAPSGTVPLNHAPRLARPNDRRSALVGHAFTTDPSQGGTTFSDPDGDPLTYDVTLGGPMLGLTVSGVLVTGTVAQPVEVWSRTVEVLVVASDGRGGSASDRFWIDVLDNTPPAVRRANPGSVVGVGASVSYDVTQGDKTFRDADGDPLSYEITFLGGPHGLRVEGTRVTGTFDAVGVTRIKVTASDGAGGSAEDVFPIAAAAPEPPRPALPATPYVYDDFKLPLPHFFRESREAVIPFWDTTPADNPTTDAGAALGRVLFYDRRLSITNTVACASCHDQARGFAKPERFSTGIEGAKTTRNSMALANVRYNIFGFFFWDERVSSLEKQVLMPIANPGELGQPLALLVPKLAATDFYPPLFAAAFGTPEVTSERVALALAQFMRSLISYRSKFDRAFFTMDAAVSPDPAAVLTAQELRGHQLFIDNRCIHCHQDNIHSAIGAANNGLDTTFTDLGTGYGQFRPASLRNLTVTAPYMHDGRFATLRAVIDHYDHGVVASPGLSSLLTELDGSPRHMNLSEDDKEALEAFLGTLTDEAFLTDPKFSDPFD